MSSFSVQIGFFLQSLIDCYQSFRALKYSFRVSDFMVGKFSNLESFRALKLSDLESFMVRNPPIVRVLW